MKTILRRKARRALLIVGMIAAGLVAWCQEQPEPAQPADQVAAAAGQPGEAAQGEGLRSLMPDSLKEAWFGIELWQLVGLLVILVVAVVVDFLARLILPPILRGLLKRFMGESASGAVLRGVRPVGLALGAWAFRGLLPTLALPATPHGVLDTAAQLVLIVALVWAAFSLINLVSETLLARAKTTESPFDDMLIPLAGKSLKLFVVAVGIIYIAQSLEIEIGPLLASFGLAGLAVSFAAQDSVRNLFGGLTIFLDRPFVIGDRVVCKGHDGMVEEIGFRTTKLRTLTGHVVTIPNGAVTSDPVENIGRRPTIRRIMNVTITYDTPRAKIQEAVRILRDILEEEDLREPIHPTIDGNEFPPRVYFNDFNADSLNIFLIYWYAPPAYWDYLDHAQRLNLRIFEEFEKAGIEFAFPTQTLYLAGDPRRELALRFLARDLEGAVASPATSAKSPRGSESPDTT